MQLSGMVIRNYSDLFMNVMYICIQEITGSGFRLMHVLKLMLVVEF